MRTAPLRPLLVTFSLVAILPVSAPAQEPKILSLVAHGTDDLYWIARVEPAPSAPGRNRNDAPVVQTTVQYRPSGSDRWRLLARLPACVVAMAARGNGGDLAVVLDDGRWQLLWPGGGSGGKPLPGGARVVAIAGEGQALWAVARGDLSRVPIGPATTRASPPATSVAVVPSPVAVQRLGLFHYTRNDWALLALLPETSVNVRNITAGDVSITVVSGNPIVALRDARLRVLRLDAGGRLHEQSTVDPYDQFELLGGPSRGTLWFDAGSPAGTIVELAETSERLPKSPEPRALPAPAGLSDRDPRAVAVAAGQLRLVYARDGKLSEQTYTRSGEPVGQAFVLPALNPPARHNLTEWITLPLVLLLSFLVFGPARRRDAQPIPIAQGDGAAVIAPVGARFAAGMIDALPVLVVSFFVSVQLRSTAEEDLYDTLYSWRWISAGSMAVYLLHTLIGELFTGRSFGKWVFGLRVVASDGTPAGIAAILVRNVFRVMEVGLWLPLLLILMTPLRQRIGDFAARTAVVTDRRADDEVEDRSD
jgi:uncharacterized RDD family membrane protein YckC